MDAPEIFHQTTISVEDTAQRDPRRAHHACSDFSSSRYRNDYVPSVTGDGAAGQIGFSGQYTGNAEADFLLGLPSYMAYGQGFAGTVGQRNSAFGAFFPGRLARHPPSDLEHGPPLGTFHAHL